MPQGVGTKGDLNVKDLLLFSGLFFSSILFCPVLISHGDLYAYESFSFAESAYSTGTLTAGENATVISGNAGFSTHHPWIGGTSPITVRNELSLSHSALPASSADARGLVRLNINGLGLSRSSQRRLTSPPAGESCYYLSGLIKTPSSGETLFYQEGEFLSAGFRNEATIYSADITAGFHVGLSFLNGKVHLSVFAGNRIYPLRDVTDDADSVYQVVIRLDADGSGKDTLRAWYAADGDTVLTPGLPGTRIETWSRPEDLEYFALQSRSGEIKGASVSFDAIFFGSSLHEVTKLIPEPSAADPFPLYYGNLSMLWTQMAPLGQAALQLIWPTTPGVRIELQESTDLIEWQTLPGYPSEASAFFQYEMLDLENRDFSRGFYRVRSLVEPVPETPAHSSIPFPEFRWPEHPDAFSVPGHPVEYEVQFATDPGFSQLLKEDRIALPRYVPDRPLPIGTHYRRVRAISPDGTPQEWSDIESFSVQEPDLTVTVAYDPEAEHHSSAVGVAIQTAMNAMIQGQSVEVVFPEGTYRSAPVPALNFIHIQNAENLTLTGHGAKIELSIYDQTFISISDSRNILVQGFEIDMPEQLPFSQGYIRSVNREEAVLQMDFEPGFPTFAQHHFRAATGAFVLLDPDVDGRLKWGSRNYFQIDSEAIDPLSDRKFEVALTAPGYRTERGEIVNDDVDLSILAQDIDEGDRFVYYLGTPSSALAYSRRSESVTFYEITDYAATRHYVAFDCSAMNFLHNRSIIKEGRWFNGYSDGIHVRSSPVGPWIEGMEINGIGDDAVALYARPNEISDLNGRSGSNTLLFKNNSFFNFEPGDSASFFRPPAGQILLETSVRSVAQDSSGFWVTFEDPVPGNLILNENWTLGDQVWNRSKSCGDFVIRNNSFLGVRRYGTVFRAKNGVIENNLYDGSSGAAIIFLNETAYPNGLYASNIIIRNNTIRNCAFDRIGTKVITSLFKRLGQQEPAESIGPRNFLIENNSIDDCGRPPLEFWSTGDVVIRNNRLNGKLMEETDVDPRYLQNVENIFFE